jgi:Chaperone of endosialidase
MLAGLVLILDVTLI